MGQYLHVVEGLAASAAHHIDLSDEREALAFALDQRAFGPGRMLVAFAEPGGRLLGFAHCGRTDPAEAALELCIRYARDTLVGDDRPLAAVAYHDEMVSHSEPPPALLAMYDRACAMAAARGVHLVDWFCCDDQLFRSCRIATAPDEPWWSAPS